MTTAKPARESAPRAPSDLVLIAAARRGDVDAFDSLSDRHRDAAMRLARRTAFGSAEDLVTETVAAVGAELRAGTGPATAFRPYLLTALRRRNLTRAKRARRRRTIDDLTSARPSGELAGIPTSCLPATARAYRALSEDLQTALWHTEVEGEPLLETATLLGIPATAVAELTFAARDAIRAAQLDEHRATVTTAACRWSTDRMAGHARNSLATKDTTRLTAHLDSCDACAAVATAVAVVESNLALLVATVVLGPAAEAYLGRESTGAAHARRTGAFTALRRDAARPAAVALSAISLITAGLLGSLAFADDKKAPDQSAARTITPTPVAPTERSAADGGPDSGSGSAGHQRTEAADRVAETAGTPRPDPIPLLSKGRATSAPQPEAPRPAAPPAPAEPAGTTLELGITSLRIVPGGGPLGLPGLSLG